jgi:hypothetical protein
MGPLRTASLLAVLGLTACASSASTAETPSLASVPVVATGPWRPLQQFILTHLEQPIARASGLPEAEPWRFDLPMEDPALRQFGPYVRQALRSRDVAPSDDRFRVLRVGALTMVGDTATVTLMVGGIFRCPGETRERGWGAFESVHTVRDAAGVWGPAWSSRRGQGDSEPCPRPH